MKFNMANGVVNTALLNQLAEMTTTQKVISTVLFGLNKKLTLVDVTKADETAKNVELLTKTTNALNTKLAEVSDNKGNANTNVDSKERKTLIESFENLSHNIAGDEKRHDRFIYAINTFDDLIKHIDKVSDKGSKFFDSFANSFEYFKFDDLKSVGQSMMLVGAGIASIGLAIFTLTYTVGLKGALIATSILGGIYTFATLINKLDTKKMHETSLSLICLSGGVILTAGAIALLSLIPNESLARTAGIFVGLTTVLTISTAVLSKLGTKKVKGIEANFAPAIIAGSLGVLALSIATFNALVTPKQLLLPILTIVGLTAAFAAIGKMTSKTVGKDEKEVGGIGAAAKGLMYAAASIAVLAASIAIWDYLEPKTIFTPVVTILALAAGLALMSHSEVYKGGKSLLLTTASIAVLAASIAIWDYLGITASSVALPGIAILALMGGLTAMAKIGQGGVIKSAGALIIASVAVGILGYALAKFENISGTTMLSAGLFVAGIATAIGGLSALSGNTLIAAAALTVGAASVLVLGMGMSKMKDVPTSTFVEAGVFLTAIGAGIAALGLVPTALLGAGALVAGAASVLVLGMGMQKFKDIKTEHIDAASHAMTTVADKMIEYGGFVSFEIAAGAASLGLAGAATIKLAQTLAILKNAKITTNDAKSISTTLSLFIDSLAKTFKNNDGNYLATFKGITAFKDLGSMIANLADGLVKMGQLKFVEYDVVDNQVVPVRARKFSKTDFENVATGVKTIIESLTKPLAEVGQNAGLLFGGDVKKGINEISGLGNVIKTIADGVAGIADLKFVEYGVVNGQVVPVDTREFGKDEFTRAGQNITSLIEAIKTPLEAIGKGSSWLSDSDLKNGIDSLEDLNDVVFKPIMSMSKWLIDNKIDDVSNAKLENSLTGLIGGVINSVRQLENYDDFDDVPDIFESINEQLQTMVNKEPKFAANAKHFESTANSLITINKELSSDKLQRIVELKDTLKQMSSQELHENFVKIIQLLEERFAPLLQQLNEQFAQTASHATGEQSENSNSTYDNNGYSQNSGTVNNTTNVNNTTTKNEASNTTNSSSKGILYPIIAAFINK